MTSDKISLKEFVRLEFESIHKKLDCLDSKLQQARIDIATLKVKAGIWGLTAGMIPAIGVLIYRFIKGD